MRPLTLLLPALLAACTAAEAPPAASPTPAGACNAEPAQDLVGQPGTEALAQDALRRTGARSLRWIQPGMAVTMDYREDRLNIELDGQGRVISLRCG